MLGRAHRHDPGLARTNTDLAILASIGPTGPLAPAPEDAVLVIVTDRPSPVQAAAALLLGARAYLPLDLPPDRTAVALRHAAQGRLHLEPETAAVLRAVAVLGAGLSPHPDMPWIVTALGLRVRGWDWTYATQAGDIDPASVQRWFADLLPRPQLLPDGERSANPWSRP
ncbi:MAG: hypothetical protein QG597_1930 [Actinomycetota bacterium]|nr:hypothetical protein [Actinomycetota bacterium]